MLLICIRTNKVYSSDDLPEDTGELMLLPLEEAEPHYEQATRSAAIPRERTDDGKYDRSHLSPENAWRIGRDYLAHCLRYGWPMKIVRDHVGPGGRFLEMGCGAEIPFFRTLTCDHSAVKYYKPSLYVAADLNVIKYRPHITGCKTVLLDRTNIAIDSSRVPDEAYDVVLSFEVLEHMEKAIGEQFLDAMVAYARRRSERDGKPGIILLSTPVNGGSIAKNHIYEWHRSELRRAWEKRGCHVVAEYGTFANLSDLVRSLTPDEMAMWNKLSSYHGPHTLSCIFASLHPESARNIAWHVEVR